MPAGLRLVGSFAGSSCTNGLVSKVRAFAAEKSIAFPVLSDEAPAGQVARAFGVYSSASGRSERAVFVLDASGTVVWSETFPDGVNPGVDDVLSVLEAIPVDAVDRLA
jgi:alkyl hydroperoxide reductase subunit AhpC